MPKTKTHSGASKRFKKLPSGKVKFTRAGRRHLLTKKSSARKRSLRDAAYVLSCDIRHVYNMLPHG